MNSDKNVLLAMRLRNKIIVGVGVLVLVGLLLATARWVLSVWFDESLYVKEGTLKYWMTIDSRTIKGFPRLGHAADVTFYYSCGDGPKPAAQGVSYVTEVDKAEVLRTADAFLSGLGFRPVKVEDDATATYEKNSTTLLLRVSRGMQGRTEVSAEEQYR